MMDPDRARELLAAERARIERGLVHLEQQDTGEPADEFGTVLDEVTAAFAGARQAMDSLHHTWDTGLRETSGS